MGRYYNKTRAPLPVTLRDGTGTSLPARSWVTLGLDQERSGSLNRLVQKGLLAYRASAPAPTPAPTPAPAPVKVAPPPPPPKLKAKPAPPPPTPPPEPEPVVEEKPTESEAPAIEVTSSAEIAEDETAFDLPDEAGDSPADDVSDDPKPDLKARSKKTSQQTEITESATDVSSDGGEEAVASEGSFGAESTPRPKKTRRRKRRS